MRTTPTSVAKGAIAGMVAGIVASWAMEAFQVAWQKGAASSPPKGDPATVKAARKVSKAVSGRAIAQSDKKQSGEVVHYATGVALGLVYGMTAERLPVVTAGLGTAFGGTIALALDEGAAPALGLAPPPTQTPPSSHLFGLVSHLVFGLAAESSRRVVRAVL